MFRVKLLIVFTMFTLSACSWFTPPLEKPVIQKQITKGALLRPGDSALGTLSLTAERRAVFLNFQSNRFCAEPPPDVAQTIISKLEAMLTKEKASLSKEISTDIVSLLARPVGIQFERDLLNSLCILYANYAIDGTEVQMRFDRIMELSASLLEKEIVSKTASQIKAPAPSAVSSSLALMSLQLWEGQTLKVKVKDPNVIAAYSDIALALRLVPRGTITEEEPIKLEKVRLKVDFAESVIQQTIVREDLDKLSIDYGAELQVILYVQPNPHLMAKRYIIPGSITYYKSKEVAALAKSKE